MGTWYEIQRDSENPHQKNGECVTQKLSLDKDGNIKVLMSQWSPDKEKIESKEGSLSCKGGMCQLVMGTFAKADYRIVDTDYDQFALVYHC